MDKYMDKGFDSGRWSCNSSVDDFIIRDINKRMDYYQFATKYMQLRLLNWDLFSLAGLKHILPMVMRFDRLSRKYLQMILREYFDIGIRNWMKKNPHRVTIGHGNFSIPENPFLRLCVYCFAKLVDFSERRDDEGVCFELKNADCITTQCFTSKELEYWYDFLHDVIVKNNKMLRGELKTTEGLDEDGYSTFGKHIGEKLSVVDRECHSYVLECQVCV